jgi:hypothetical protein
MLQPEQAIQDKQESIELLLAAVDGIEDQVQQLEALVGRLDIASRALGQSALA